MTRKITLSVILILLVLGCYTVVFGHNEIVNKIVPPIRQLSENSDKLNEEASKVEAKTTTEYDKKKKKLKETIERYNESKEEFDTLVPDSMLEEMASENTMKEIYDVDFLWTVVGNYATEEGVTLKFDVKRNTTSKSSLQNNSVASNYVICDLEFIVTGKYINLTDFIYHLEDDDRLNFEINDFKMIKSGTDLQITLNVKEVKVNATNLIETAEVDEEEQTEEGAEGENTQEINSNTTNATNTTNTTKSSNTTKNTNTTNTANSTKNETTTKKTTVSNDVN